MRTGQKILASAPWRTGAIAGRKGIRKKDKGGS